VGVRVAVLVGSLRAGSLNKRLALALERSAPADWVFERPDIGALPLYDDDLLATRPPVVASLKHSVAVADAVMIVSPEYNRSIPGVLKNALDWASRPPAENVFAGKPVLIAGATTGRIGTAVMQSHLRVVLAFMAAVPMPRPELYITLDPPDLIGPDGVVTQPATARHLEGAMTSFAAWVARHG